MNDNKLCILQILRDHGGRLTTSQILELTQKYPTLCKGCSSGTQVISAGMQLVEEGAVIREVSKGGFIWTIKQNQ